MNHNLDRFLLKWYTHTSKILFSPTLFSVCYALLSHCTWLIDLVPLLPMGPIKLFLGLWILMPNYQGETVVYLCVSEYLAKFE